MTTTYDIYRNLLKGTGPVHVWSLQRHGGRVEGHGSDFVLLDVTFHCTEKAMRKFHAENDAHPDGKAPRKVFAKMRGTLSEASTLRATAERDGVRVSLDPHDPMRSLGFYRYYDPKHGKVTRADAVIFTVNGAFAINPS